MFVQNVLFPRYACYKNAHLRKVNSAFYSFASLENEHSDPNTVRDKNLLISHF